MEATRNSKTEKCKQTSIKPVGFCLLFSLNGVVRSISDFTMNLYTIWAKQYKENAQIWCKTYFYQKHHLSHRIHQTRPIEPFFCSKTENSHERRRFAKDWGYTKNYTSDYNIYWWKTKYYTRKIKSFLFNTPNMYWKQRLDRARNVALGVFKYLRRKQPIFLHSRLKTVELQSCCSSRFLNNTYTTHITLVDFQNKR